MARWYFLACLSFALSLVAGLSPIYELRGKKAHLLSNIPGRPDNILWKHDGNKAVEFTGQVEEVYGQYENRITLDWVSAELDISDLTYEDSGEYELEAVVKGKLHEFKQTLRVIDHVPEPTIKCDLNDGGSTNVSGVLLCSATSERDQSLMTFKWTSHGPVQLGQYLTIPLGDSYDDEVYSCEVSNPRSHNTATFAAKDCYPDTSPSAIIPIISGLVALISILLVCLSVLYCKLKKKACFGQQNVEAGSPETKGSDEEAAEDEEKRLLFNGAPTPPSTELPGREAGKGSDEEAAEDEEKCPLVNGSPTPPSPEPLGHEAGEGHDINSQDDSQDEDEMPQKGSAESAPIDRTPTIPSKQRLVQEHDRDEQPPQPGHDINSQDDSQDEDEMPQKGSAESARIDRTPTIPSKQRLVQEHDRDEQPPQPGHDINSQDDSQDEDEMPQKGSAESARIDRTPTIPSKQRLVQEQNRDEQPPQPGYVRRLTKKFETGSPNPATEKEFEPSVTEPEPAAALANTRPDLEASVHTAPEVSDENKDEEEETPSPPSLPPLPDPNNLTSNEKGDAEDDQLSEPEPTEASQSDSSDAERENEQEPASVSPEKVGSVLDSSAAPEHSESEKEEAEDDKAKSPPANVAPPIAKPRLRWTPSSPPPPMAPEDSAGDHKGDASSDQVNPGTASSREGETNKSDASNDDEQSSPVFKQNDQDAAEKDSDSESDNHEKDLYSAPRQKPESPAPTKQDNGSADACQESAEAALKEPVHKDEGKAKHDSDESDEEKNDA